MPRYLRPVCGAVAVLCSGFGAMAADFPSTRVPQPPPCDRLDPRCEAGPPPSPPLVPPVPNHRLQWLELWGYAGLQGFFTGERMAPNGVAFNPIFALDSSFNVGILPNQRAYLFIDSKFW